MSGRRALADDNRIPSLGGAVQPGTQAGALGNRTDDQEEFAVMNPVVMSPRSDAATPNAPSAPDRSAVDYGSAWAIRVSRSLWSLAFLVVVAHVGYTVVGVGRGTLDELAREWAPFAVFLLCAATSFTRALAHRRERAGWAALAVGLTLYAVGQLYYVLVASKDPSPTFPSGADLLWLSMYAFAIIAVVLLVRAQRTDTRADLWLDGAIAGLTIGSLGVVVIFNHVIEPVAALQAAPGNVAFALGDLLVVGLGVGSCSLLGWRPPLSLVVLVAAFAAQAFQDTAYLSALVHGTLTPGTFLDSWWLLGLLFITAAAAWPRPASARPAARAATLVAFPFVFALVAVGLSTYGALADSVTALAVVLTALTLLAAVVRFALTFRAHLTMIDRSGREAMTDALTGLGNRRRLLRDVATAVAEASQETPLTLVIFDLDGFKTYNDTYGHPAGDALLKRLGEKLAQAVMPCGEAYRLGGDEFCALLWGDERARHEALAATSAALTEEGEAFTIGSSYGSVVVPTEVDNVTEALRRADQRLYAAKDAHTTAPATETCDVLRTILLESEPELDDHHNVVARLARGVGNRLGLTGHVLRDLVRGAELHDIGKIAIPDAILHKPGPLTDDEWLFMKRHTTIGERFLASIPSLAAVARLVRSSHERFDGAGYPDGLAAEEIPLGARIIFACDAYDAMIADRAYRVGMPREAAVAELRRNAGTQFDPVVIDALCAELAATPYRREASARLGSANGADPETGDTRRDLTTATDL